MNHAASSIAILIFLVFLVAPAGRAPAALAQRYTDFSTKTPLEDGHVLIIGFVGGRESWDDKTQGVRKFALALRAQNHPGVFVETVRNNKRRAAIELIRNAFDRNRDGRLDESEGASARLVVYGQSFGGAAVVKLARQLEKMKIPVLLTVQIDSVGRNDGVIPANVIRAANLFQRNGLIIRGERPICARDPSATEVIGNFEFDYRKRTIDISGVSWIKKIFRSAHTKMDQDPAVWSLVEKLIMESISSSPGGRPRGARPRGAPASRGQGASIRPHLAARCPRDAGAPRGRTPGFERRFRRCRPNPGTSMSTSRA